MEIIDKIAEMKNYSAREREAGRSVVLVPTMGALHEGHVELFRRAREEGDTVVASIFVNPAQFGPKEDLLRYPKSLKEDMELAREEGVDALFTPGAGEIYPEGFDTHVEVGGLSGRLCGLKRPGHFRGVATVVLKLFNIVAPAKAVFGLKDFQQFLVIRRMIRDFDLDVELVAVETVRESDGLAISSRNSYLKSDERSAARTIPRALALAEELFKGGERDGAKIAGEVKKSIENEPRAVIDYIAVCDAESLADLDRIDNGALVAVAIKFGRARLIDNVVLGKGPF